MRCGGAAFVLSAVCAAWLPGAGQSAPPIVLTAPLPVPSPPPPPPPPPLSPNEQNAASPAPKTPYRITGTVVSANDLTPMAHVGVGIEADKPCSAQGPPRHPAVTGADGRFSIAVPCAGTWRVTARGADLPAQRYEAHGECSTGVVLTPAAPTFEVTFAVAAAGSIFGFVTDEGGESVRNGRVLLFEADLAGSLPVDRPQTESPQPAGGTRRRYAAATTDDRGLYEFANVRPGAWVVAVDTTPWYAAAVRRSQVNGAGQSAPPLEPELDVAYPLTYFPGTADAGAASRIALASGAREEADVRLTPVPSIHLRIPSAAAGVRRLGPPTLERVTPFGDIPFRTNLVSDMSDGALEIAGLAPSTYLVGDSPFGRTRNSDSGDEPQPKVLTLGPDAPHTVDLSTAVARATPSAAKAPGAVSGVVSFQSRPDAGAMILLMAAGSAMAAPLRAQSNTDGSFVLAQVPPGSWILVAVDHGWSSSDRDPDAVAQYRAHGTPVFVAAGAEAHQNVTAIAP